ncbi:hypothetical protein COO60DRAFT_718198 [Scenedesmus sp. NREL 46B-D3]|nr:hypothetical protein COO60DRAFT_718198 [Scenedesmus sp. NREL 46B-D3]
MTTIGRHVLVRLLILAVAKTRAHEQKVINQFLRPFLSLCAATDFGPPQVEPQRSIANIRLPCAGLPSICALQHPSAGGVNALESGGAASSLSGQSDIATLAEDADEVGLGFEAATPPSACCCAARQLHYLGRLLTTGVSS